jgi:hypothetical protein
MNDHWHSITASEGNFTSQPPSSRLKEIEHWLE